MPKRPFHVIRRGSSYLIEADENTDEKTIKAIVEKLEKLQAVGERQREGYGRFEINLPVTLLEKKAALEREQIKREQQKAEEEKAKEAEQLKALQDKAQEVIMQHADNAKKYPNDRQWQALFDKFQNIPSSLDSLQKMAQFTSGLLGKPCYQTIGGANLARYIYEAACNESGEFDASKVLPFLKILKHITEQEEQ